MIFHADRGCQYTSTQLATVADDLGVRLSVGRTGVCFDNAQQESFWSSLKTEFYNRHTFTTRAEAIHAVTSWIGLSARARSMPFTGGVDQVGRPGCSPPRACR